MRPNVKFVVKILFGIVCLFLYCEWLIYYFVLLQCDWPQLDPSIEDPFIKQTHDDPVRVMVLADTHLLGSKEGHWFDKLRREWQMYRTFQTAMKLHKPDIVFVLGDLTDEGLWCSDAEFQYYIRRFHSLFSVPQNTRMYVTVGNHDIGFHYRISPYLNQRFVSGFNSSAVQLITLRGNHFVLVNSMALEGDGCFLCRAAELQLSQIEKILKCASGRGSCDGKTRLKIYSKPILMQHFPLYRKSDEDCDEPDEAPFPIKTQKFKEGWDCLSKESTYQLLKQIEPRLVLSGHTHHGCTRNLPNSNGIEITIPSFSWRNKDNPSYGLMVVTPNNYSFSKCLMPKESTVINSYMLGGAGLLCWIVYALYKRTRRLLTKIGRILVKYLIKNNFT
ncbi:hypothetical protein ILUMI_00618 [Ignelater luminosus]|uniref:Calcineurin-like phosphoesterase domain-containing protein n=1 Tax=Ignelater luminosus TaxID=2038154 RepID=A0A8K0DFY1_IGNLU|nr:hypothetical protein ILUMI_00618 [Ignelater luminosus]